MSKQLDFQVYRGTPSINCRVWETTIGASASSAAVLGVKPSPIAMSATPYGGTHNASVELGSGLEEGGALSSVILCARTIVAWLIRSKSGRTSRPS